jgi:hypothetical protein
VETVQQGGQGGGGQTAKATMPVPLNLLTQTFQNLAKRANTREQKHYLFIVGEGVGGAITKQYPGGGFNAEEWMTECGIQHEWATIAA